MTEIDLEALARRALDSFPPGDGDRDLARTFARRLLFKDHGRAIGAGDIETVGARLDALVDRLELGGGPAATPAPEPPALGPADLTDAEIEDCVARSFDAVFDGTPERAEMIAGRARQALDRLIEARGISSADGIRMRAEPIIERYRSEIDGRPGRRCG